MENRRLISSANSFPANCCWSHKTMVYKVKETLDDCKIKKKLSVGDFTGLLPGTFLLVVFSALSPAAPMTAIFRAQHWLKHQICQSNHVYPSSLQPSCLTWSRVSVTAPAFSSQGVLPCIILVGLNFLFMFGEIPNEEHKDAHQILF